MTGSAEQAEAAMAWITDFTARTPYELQEVSNGFRQLAAYGLDPTKHLKPLGDTASSMGKTLSQAVEMFADAAQGEFERLKEFGVRASQQGDTVTFRWSQNGRDMVRTARKTQQGITTTLGEIFRRFEGGMQKQSRSWEGMMSNVSDIWTQWKLMVMKSGPFRVMKKSLEEFLKSLETSEGRMNLARWAAMTAEVIVGAFQGMVVGAELFLDSIDVIKKAWVGLHRVVGRFVHDFFEALSMLPGLGDKFGWQQLAAKSNLKKFREEYAEIDRSLDDREKAFDKVFSLLKKWGAASSDLTLMAAKGDASEFKFAGGGNDAAAGVSKTYTSQFDDHIKEWQKYQDRKTATLERFSKDYQRITLGETAFQIAEVQARSRQLQDMVVGDADTIAQIKEWEAKSIVEINEQAAEKTQSVWEKYAASSMDQMSNMGDMAATVGRRLEDSFTDAFTGAEVSAMDFFNAIYAEMIRISVAKPLAGVVTGGIGSIIGSLFPSAKGNVLSGAGISSLSNGIYSSPTYFGFDRHYSKFANGGVLAEAGIEGVFPLARTASGDLGVQAVGNGRSGGNGGDNVQVIIHNSTGQSATQQKSSDNYGNTRVDVMIGDAAAKQLATPGSSLNRAMRSSTGMKQQVVRR
ncbi:tape measure protein [Pseudodesulfovibrio tunisiensis]|uniref:tape measure protein n=1 Tax=Pseudodesulfovibrio tunisiensis TaxID=463192 RepID=UPI001FB2167B|nr:tape measure protein [Pseudodesulfovibrio tunisiensis]